MAWDRHSVLERCAISAATAWGFYLMARFINHRWRMTAQEQQLLGAQASLEHERVKRKADRVGRIRAEQELRAVKVQLQQLQLQLQMQPQRRYDTPEGGGVEEQRGQEDGAPAGEGREERVATSVSGAEAEALGAFCGINGGGVAVDVAAGQLQPQLQPHQREGRRRGPQAQSGAASGAEGADGGVDGAAAATTASDMKRTAAAAAAALAAAGSAMPAFPFRPIGHLQSVFSERNGTPRQPQLVPAARSRLVLCPNVPRACLEGLEQYSHCWVLYVFHANTDLAKYLSPDRSGLKAKIHVPRLNGGRMGVLATRSPHRPSPIGLSTAEIIRVEGSTLVLGGADIVDGSPVLDIKPYVPFCDCLPTARAPAWVQAEAEDEPLAVEAVVISEAAQAALLRAWSPRKTQSMYDSVEQYIELVQQVLSRDIRSVHQRLNVKPCTAVAAAAALSAGIATDKANHPPPLPTAASTAPSAKTEPHSGSTFALTAAAAAPAGSQAAVVAPGEDVPGEYHVVLENIYISYDIGPTGVVHVRDAWVDPITVR